jgi:hypothetical protein
MNYTTVVFGGTIVLSLIWYYCPKVSYICLHKSLPSSHSGQYGGVHWFHGPIANVPTNNAFLEKERSTEDESANNGKASTESQE